MESTYDDHSKVWLGLLALGAAVTAAIAPASAQSLNGQVLGAGAPIANTTVTLWAASAGAPAQLAQARTGADGRFALNAPGARGKERPGRRSRPARRPGASLAS